MTACAELLAQRATLEQALQTGEFNAQQNAQFCANTLVLIAGLTLQGAPPEAIAVQWTQYYAAHGLLQLNLAAIAATQAALALVNANIATAGC